MPSGLVSGTTRVLRGELVHRMRGVFRMRGVSLVSQMRPRVHSVQQGHPLAASLGQHRVKHVLQGRIHSKLNVSYRESRRLSPAQPRVTCVLMVPILIQWVLLLVNHVRAGLTQAGVLVQTHRPRVRDVLPVLLQMPPP